MQAFIDGEFLPEEKATISVFDRSFLYGDGLFETMFVLNQRVFRWQQHLTRLRQGAEFLRLKLPFSAGELAGAARELIRRNRLPTALLRLTLSRGVGPRGYSIHGASRPTVVMTLHPPPAIDPNHTPQWRLCLSSFRLPAGQPLARFKTCNKLPQILARAEASEAEADEALLLNTDGFVIEGASSNLFWIAGGGVCTPPTASGILPGVTRAVVQDLCETLRLPCREADVRPPDLAGAEGVFLSLSSLGIVEAASLDGVRLRRSPIVEPLRRAYWQLARAETASG